MNTHHSAPPAAREPEGGAARRLLVVCDGNICRSPVALARLRRHQADGRLAGWECDSAGLVAGAGDVPLAPTRIAARAAGVPVDGHLARPLSRRSDRPHLALIMEERQRPPVMEATGLPAERVLMLGSFAGGEAAIADPFGGDEATYRACVAQIVAAVDGLVAWLESAGGA